MMRSPDKNSEVSMRKIARRRFFQLAAVVLAALACSRLARAEVQDYPNRPVRIITHSAPGGSPDALLRIVGDRLSQMWGCRFSCSISPAPVAR
jgi:tripartite-type tricarboxylate transporter receptor subunit TctC